MDDRDVRLTEPEEAASRGRPVLLGRVPGAAVAPGWSQSTSCDQPLRHVLMNAFRSSPLRALAFASALHFFIFSCWVMGAASPPPLRQVDMKALRSSPFLSPAWVLHAFMRSCCGLGFFSSAPEATESVPAISDIATAIASSVLMSPSSLNVEAAAQPQGSEPSRSSGPLPAPSFSRPGA